MLPNGNPKRLLLVRNDRLGDFMLAWPAFRLLKERLPDTRLVGLVPEYTRPMAELCPWLDEVVVDPGVVGMAGVVRLTHVLRRAEAEAAIALFSTGRVATALAAAGIRYRLAPATKLAQFIYSDRLVQHRSESAKPEFEYNADLVRHYLARLGQPAAPTPPGPFLEFPSEETASLRERIAVEHKLPVEACWIFVHAGSGGSATNLTLEQYRHLCHRLAGPERVFLFTAGRTEVEGARWLAGKMSGHGPATVLAPATLPLLTRQLALADLFISGSTGPLHIAGALDRPTATFYPRHRSGSPLRWQTLNAPEKRLAFTPPEDGDPRDVSRCDLAAAAAAIEALLSR